MKFKLSRILLFVLALLILTPQLHAQDELSEVRKQAVLESIMATLENAHYVALRMDDAESEKVYKLYVDRMDPGKRFFLQEDIDKLKKHQKKIDDQVNSRKFDFFDLSCELYEKRMGESENYYKEILDQPFDFTREETATLDAENMDWAKNEKEIKEYWRKSLKYQTMTRLYDALEIQETAQEKSDTTVEILDFTALEAKARGKVLKSHDEWFHRMKQQNHEDYLVIYMNCIAATYGPHTGYYPPKDKENFDINMSGKLEGIGATLQEKGGYIKVTRIVPGSPSWKQGELEADDVILKVAQADEKPVDIVDMRLDEAVQLIRGKKGTEVRLTVKKPDGVIKVIPIIRDVVVLEETYAKSLIIKRKDTNEKIGYIQLPSFYADFSRQGGGRNCSSDVANEVEKLKEEGVDGIVLDLRSNGGGSLRDVVKMAGLFIERGPIVQIKSRYGEPEVLSDRDSKVQYDGPLVVMVNEYSASASEIMAAAIQDYDRGVIIGSNSTFGKGTVQRFYDLDRMIKPTSPEATGIGHIKLTTQKFYRINGGATQLKGVIPDIVLPDNLTYVKSGEKEYEYAMPWDEIDDVEYTSWDHDEDAYTRAIMNSQVRVNNSSAFQLINERALKIKENRDEKELTLNFEGYKAERKNEKEEGERYKALKEEIETMELVSLPSTIAEMAEDSTKMERVKVWHENLQKDHYIDEALYVIHDMIKE